MKTRSIPQLPQRGAQARSGEHTTAGFTMVEIALSLGIIAFALIAIIGVLPSGLQVQRENHEDTVIDMDGRLILEAIRGGAKSGDDLFKHVELVRIQHGPPGARNLSTFVYAKPGVAGVSGASPLVNAAQMIGLLSTPAIEINPDGSTSTNIVEAQMTSISGKVELPTQETLDLAFRYRVRVELTPFSNLPRSLATTADQQRISNGLAGNLYELRLTLAWPYVDRGGKMQVGRNRRIFRTLVAGELRERLAPFGQILTGVYYFEPSTFKSLN